MSKNPRKTPRSKETPDPEQDQPEGDLPEVSVELEPDDPEAPEWWTSGLIPLPDDLATDCEAARAVGGIRKTKFTFEEWDRIGTAVVAIRRFADQRIEASQGNRNTFQHILRQEGIAELIAAPKQENYLYATCTRLLAQQAKKAEVLAWRDQLTPEQREAWQSPHSVERHCPALGGTFVKYAPNTANLSDPDQVTGGSDAGDGQRYDDLPPLPDDDEEDDWGDDTVHVCPHCDALNRIPAAKDLGDVICCDCRKPLVEPDDDQEPDDRAQAREDLKADGLTDEEIDEAFARQDAEARLARLVTGDGSCLVICPNCDTVNRIPAENDVNEARCSSCHEELPPDWVYDTNTGFWKDSKDKEPDVIRKPNLDDAVPSNWYEVLEWNRSKLKEALVVIDRLKRFIQQHGLEIPELEGVALGTFSEPAQAEPALEPEPQPAPEQEDDDEEPLPDN